MKGQWNDKILAVSPLNFNDLALELFCFQYENNFLYKDFADALGRTPSTVHSLEQVPYLPIRFFKSHSVKSGLFNTPVIFESSGTTGESTSRHYIKETDLYKQVFTRGFESFYGSVPDWCILGLLPSYLERQNSSLVYMVDDLIRQSGHPCSGFYLDEFDKLSNILEELEQQKQKTLLIGVTFALLDFADIYNGMPLQQTVIMETGGMKGRREEMVREQVHEQLKKAFKVPAIHSEYGMTELLSQAYSKGNGIFQTSPSMKILIRDEEDPLLIHQKGTGAINIIDLANAWSCSFIATDDAGRLYEDGSFEVIGRLDNSDLRGCSLLTL